MNTEIEAPPSDPPKLKKIRPRKIRLAAPPQKLAEFTGLTPSDCCDACNEKKCVISGTVICCHPFKGGLQSAQMSKPDVVSRFNRAKRTLAGQALKID